MKAQRRPTAATRMGPSRPFGPPALALPLLAVAGLATGCSQPSRTLSASEREVPRVEKIFALGRMEPRGGILAISGPPGARIKLFFEGITQGATVAKGQPLFRIENHDDLQANCNLIRAQLEEATSLIKAEEQSTGLLEEEIAIEERQAGELNPLDLAAQRAKVAVLAAGRDEARHALKTLRDLKDSRSGAVSQQQIDAQELVVRRADGELDGGRALLEKMARADGLGKAKLKLQHAKAKCASDKAKLLARERSLRETLKVAELQLGRATICAPAAGRVLAVLARQGETIGPQPVLQLGDTAQMGVVAEVSDRYFQDLGRAGRATIILPTGPNGRKLAGEVLRDGIGWMVGKNALVSLNPTETTDRRIVEVRLRLIPDEASSDGAGNLSEEIQRLSNLPVNVEINLNAETAGGRVAAGAPTPRPRP